MIGGGGTLGYHVFSPFVRNIIGKEWGARLAEKIFEYEPQTKILAPEVHDYSSFAVTFLPSVLFGVIVTIPVAWYLCKKVDEFFDPTRDLKKFVEGMDDFNDFYKEMKKGLRILTE